MLPNWNYSPKIKRTGQASKEEREREREEGRKGIREKEKKEGKKKAYAFIWRAEK